MSSGSFTLESKHGLISITDTGRKNASPALLLIHGNSSSSKIFKHLLGSEKLQSTHRIVTFDLPGHGASSNSQIPEETYSMRGYADLAVEILAHMNIARVIVFGWSLGGHVGIEMVRLLPESALKGLLIVGTPPSLSIEEANRGFTFQDGHMSLAGKRDFTEDDIKTFSRSTAGAPFEQWMEDDVRRCDGKSRMLMWKKLADGVGVDQRKVVEEWDGGIVGVVNGADEPFVDLDYLDGIRWKKLWKGKCLRLQGQGHAPFWERPQEFEPLLIEFLGDCEKAWGEGPLSGV
ncbi:alpha/beta-hydrolase [Lophiostoma macrostomum CBS 122681]|uniref:Alpha/beta-hydrolase n=1 Tax=Lophiostoma macrostomum CBS 122681 TaxID=1314788 RepID=A0A6A6TMR6_9PLEO|nr:alpha/beta-hydrolase [Lophiostoma macrostomum CBS 122681]